MSVISAKGVSLAGKTIMSGIQPTGVFHVGNLLGAVKGWVDMNKTAGPDTKLLYMIADLHALTVSKPPQELLQHRWGAMASLLAAGIDPNQCSIYFQSQIPAHSELHWILSSVSSMGYLSRMVQWKSKSNLDHNASINSMGNQAISNLNLALFSYPTLQAADILVNGADLVPVGDDQAQHLELTRHLAQSFNHRFGETFKLPSTVLTPHKRILSLRDPTKKMSKSDPDPSSCIMVTDTTDEVAQKIKRAVTDSVQGPITFDFDNRPGVSNLLLIGSGFEGIEPQDYIKVHALRNHADLKGAVASSVESYIKPIREKYFDLLQDRSQLERTAREGAAKVNESTRASMVKINQAVGF